MAWRPVSMEGRVRVRGRGLRMKLLHALGAALFVMWAVVSPAAAASGAEHSPSSADARLKALYNGYASWDAKESGYFEDSRGEVESAGYLAHVDAASELRRGAHVKELLEQLNFIPAGKLSPDECVNAAVFRTLLENAISDAHFRTWEMPFNSDSSFWTYLDSTQPLGDAAEYRRYIARMRDIPRYFDEQIANMRAGLARGFSVPRATLEGRDASIAAFLADDLAKSPFSKAFDTMPSTIPVAEQRALRSQGESAIREAVN